MITDEWIYKKVTFTLTRFASEGHGILIKRNGSYIILNDYTGNTYMPMEEKRGFSSALQIYFGENNRIINSSITNLKLADDIEEPYPIGFRFADSTYTYEVIEIPHKNTYNLKYNGGSNVAKGISKNTIYNVVKNWDQIAFKEHNEGLFRPKQAFNFNDVVSHINGTYYIIASDLNSNKEYICLSLYDNTYKTIKANNLKLSTIEEATKKYAKKVTIISAEESGSIFGYKSRKQSLVNTQVNIEKLELAYECQKDRVRRDTIIVNPGGRFILSDTKYFLEIPKVIKQKHKPDLTIKTGCLVRVVNNKKTVFEQNAKCEVIKIEKTTNKRYKTTKVNNPLDVLYLKNPKTGKVHPIYSKNVKKIINE